MLIICSPDPENKANYIIEITNSGKQIPVALSIIRGIQ